MSTNEVFDLLNLPDIIQLQDQTTTEGTIMVQKIVCYISAAVNVALSIATVNAISAAPAGSFASDSLVITAAFIVGIAAFLFVPLSIAAALVLYAHDAI
jgi:hypothetical protein